MAIPSLMLLMSACMKLAGAREVVESLSKAGFARYIYLIGFTELLSVVLLWIPKTRNTGFFLMCSYLGGAMSIELAGGKPPSAAIFLTLIWIAVFLRDRNFFYTASAGV